MLMPSVILYEHTHTHTYIYIFPHTYIYIYICVSVYHSSSSYVLAECGQVQWRSAVKSSVTGRIEAGSERLNFKRYMRPSGQCVPATIHKAVTIVLSVQY